MAANEPLADRVRVVLVRPAIAGNLGATARVMRNFGLGDLRLVAPLASVRDRQARQMSTHGELILDAAKSHADLASAVADCVLVLATSARTGGRFREDNVRSPRTAMAWARASLSTGHVALVFGPEQAGLTNDEVTLCHGLVHVATNPEYPALNLAQAVAIVLYELHEAMRETRVAPSISPATHEQLSRAFQALEASLSAIGYLRGENGPALMHALRHLIARAQPTAMEVNLLLGLARQMTWSAENVQRADCLSSGSASGFTRRDHRDS